MAYSVSQQSNQISAYVTKYLADTMADVANLPTDVTPGSTCMVIETASIYILNNQRQWVPFGAGSGGGSGSGVSTQWSPF